MVKPLIFTAFLGLGLTGCSYTSIPEGVTPVSPFKLEAYLGTWYEIRRLDHSFEEGLTEVTATYSRREDGGVKVINKGYSAEDDEWDQAEGKAYFVDEENTGRLKVSFFGPFYGGYNIAKLSPNYDMALIIGPTKEYAWLLSKTPTPPKAQCDDFLKTAEALGIKDDQWIKMQSCQSE
jgi:apolipoprotein D and lipocalin family protein